MVESVKSVEAESNSVSKRRPKPKLSIEEQVLVTLEYWREYRTYFHIGTSGQLSESTIGRIVNIAVCSRMKYSVTSYKPC